MDKALFLQGFRSELLRPRHSFDKKLRKVMATQGPSVPVARTIYFLEHQRTPKEAKVILQYFQTSNQSNNSGSGEGNSKVAVVALEPAQP